MPAPETLIKRPNESRAYNIDFVNLLAVGPPAETITTVSSVTGSPAGLTITSPIISGTKVQVRISGGTNGIEYVITANIITSDGNTLEDCGTLLVLIC